MDPLPLEQLVAVGALWNRSRREITTSFEGTSMLPAIAPGQPVTLVCDSEVAEGDVILVVQGGVPTLHRAVMVTRPWILCRGDANLIPDAPIRDRSLIVGRVVSVPPHRPGLPQRIVLHCCRLLLRTWFSGGSGAIQFLIALRRWSAAVLIAARRAMQS